MVDQRILDEAAAHIDEASEAGQNLPKCGADLWNVSEKVERPAAKVPVIYDVDVVVVGGGVATPGPLVLEPLRRAVNERVTLVPTGDLRIVSAALGSTAGAIGAALVGMDQEDPKATRPMQLPEIVGLLPRGHLVVHHRGDVEVFLRDRFGAENRNTVNLEPLGIGRRRFLRGGRCCQGQGGEGGNDGAAESPGGERK